MPLADSQKSSLERPNENGGISQSGGASGVGLCPPGALLTATGGVVSTRNIAFNRNNSRYGVPIDESAVKMVYKIRSRRLSLRVKITDRCLLMAMIGILLMIVDNELCSQRIFGIDKVLLAQLFGGSFPYSLNLV